MSRGPGTVQHSILAALARSNAEIPLNLLCWEIGAPQGRDLAPDFYKSFHRAVDRLENSGRIAAARRRLVDLDEVVRVYPSKATTLTVKALRERLLPLMKAYLDETGDRRFGPAKNELHVLSKKPPSAGVRANWQEIEPRLLAQGVEAKTDAERRALIAVVSKGRSLLVVRSRSVSGSFGTAIGEYLLTALASNDIELAEDLKKLYYECFDQAEHQKVLLKDRLYAVVDFTSNTTPSLRSNFKLELLKRDPDYIRSLPGHLDLRHSGTPKYEPTRYSGLLDALLRRDVLTEFVFLSAPRGLSHSKAIPQTAGRAQSS